MPSDSSNPKPQKRSEALRPLSRQHHHALLLCWKIRRGLSLGIDVIRMENYAHWFATHHLQPHFQEEEEKVFPLLSEDHPMRVQALQDHRDLRTLFNGQEMKAADYSLLAEKLEQHIRFEERTLFPEIQRIAKPEQMLEEGLVEKEATFEDNLSDPFWL